MSETERTIPKPPSAIESKRTIPIPPSALKKKDLTDPSIQSISTSDLGGSTSDLGGSTSGVQPKTEFPSVTGAELAIKTIDFESLFDKDNQDMPPAQRIKSLEESISDSKAREAKRVKIENTIRQNTLKNPDLLKGPENEVNDILRQKALETTRDPKLADEIVNSLSSIKRDKDLLDNEIQEPLDITPDFNQDIILGNIHKINTQNKKEELISNGYSEDDADKESKILTGDKEFISKLKRDNFNKTRDILLSEGKTKEEADSLARIAIPLEEEIKSVDYNLNMNKIKSDYLSYLEKNDPEKINDIKSASSVGNFKGERALRFMQESLMHQSDIVSAKINNILSKGAENLSEEDINSIQTLESQNSRLEKRFKGAIYDYPEMIEKIVAEKAAQKEVDESYKKAKANALLPGFDGDNARAEVLYHQVISPILGASVNLVGNVVGFTANMSKMSSNDEISSGMAGIVSDWANGYFDTEKSASIYKKPSELKGSIFENGDLKAEKLVPKISETLFQMYALLGGGAAVGGALESAGIATGAAQKIGLVTSSFVTTQNDYYNEAKDLGLSDSESNNFANASALSTSLLELINPQSYVFGKEAKKEFTKGVVKMIKDGVDMKTAIKENSKFIGKELIGENAQEFSQTFGDLGVKYLFNKKNQENIFDINITQDEIKETILLTSIVAGGGSAHGVKSRNGLEVESLYRATKDIDKFTDFLNKPETQEQFTEKELKDVHEKVVEYKKVVDGLPNNLDENSKVKLANLVYNKKKLNESKKDVYVDETVSAKAGDDIQTQINEIDGQISMVFDEQTNTNIDTPISSLKLDIDGGKTEYKIGEQFFSESEIVNRLSDPKFAESVKNGDVDLVINNPSENVSKSLEGSGLLTNKQLNSIKPEEVTVEAEKAKEPEAVKEPVKESIKEPKTKPVESKVGDSINKLSESIGEDLAGPVNVFNKPEVFNSLIETAQTIANETGFEGKKLIDEVKSKLSETLGEDFNPENIDDISGEITESIKKGETDKIEERKTKAKAKISSALEKLKNSAGTTLSSGGINKESIEAVGELVAGYIELGALNTAQVVQKVLKDLKAVGIDATEEDVMGVADNVKEFFDLKKSEVVVEKPVEQKTEKKPTAKKESPKEKQSGFQERTLSAAEGTPAKEQVKRVVEENKQFYTVMNIQGSVDQASKEIEGEGGFDAAFEGMIVENTNLDDLAMLQVKRQLALDFYGGELDAAVKDGRKKDADKAYNRVKLLQDAISKSATKAGQSISMLQIWKSLRPDGTVDFMDRKLKDYNKSRRSDKPRNSRETIGQTIDNFQDFMTNLTNDQIDEILSSDKGQKAIDKALSKISGSTRNELKDKINRRKSKVDSVVNRLDSLKIKGDKLFALPPGINLLPDIWNGSIEVIKKSIQAGESMATAIDKAVAYIKSNVGEEDFGEKVYRAQFAEEKKSLDSDSEIKSEINKAMKDLGVNIKDIIKEHYSKKDALARTLAEKLTENANLTNEEATLLSKAIENEFKSKVKERAEKELSKAMGVSRIPVKREIKKLADDLIEKINLGALDTEFYNGLFADKFKLAKPLTVEQRTELKRLADIVSKQVPGSLFERQATMDMLGFMDQLYPKNNMFNTFFSLYYSSMLSGMSTSVLNIVSAGSNIVSKPIRDVVNFSKWYKAVRKGVEGGSVKDFLAYAPFNDMFYMPAALTHAASLGTKEFAEVWKNGDLDSKFIEQVANKEFSKLSPLERAKYGKHAFKPINVNIGGKKISLNPFNYYKYAGRNLAAQDKMMFRFSHDLELVSIIREQQLDKGLRGEELRKAVIDEYTQRNTDMDAVNERLEKEISSLEADTGKKVTPRQRKIRMKEILSESLSPEILETSENIGRSSIFTDSRGGLLANTAAAIGKISNLNPGLAFIFKPWVPFTKVVGNVSEYMMDTIPIYGQMRANGLGVTGLAKWVGVKNINTSQMGVPGSREYYEQMGRAWFGTVAFLGAAAMLLGADEEDEIYITGGYSPDKFKRGRENVTPKYIIVVKGVEIPYLNIPGLAVPLAMIGNYNDRINMGDSQETMDDRLWATSLSTVSLLKDMSFLQGVQDLTDMISDIASGEVHKSGRAGKELYKKYFLTLTKPLPQNFNLVDQIEKLFDPTSFSQKDIKDITMYGLGFQRFFNKPSLDVFGDTIKTLPGSSLLPYDHWMGLKGNDDRWKFLAKHNSIPNSINGNDEIYFLNGDDIERRTPNEQELFDYTKKAGENFSNMIKDYMSEGGFEDREKAVYKYGGKEINGIQKDIKDMWSYSKKNADMELFVN